MKMQDIITLLASRLSRLNSQHADAMRAGDIERITTLDAQITETEDTLAKLRTLTD